MLVRAIAEDRPRLLVWLGPLVGLGLLNKYSMSWLVAGTVAGLVVTPSRTWLARREIAIAAGVACCCSCPHVVWQPRNGFPALEFMRNAQQMKNVQLPFIPFWRELTLSMNPFTAPAWLGGLVGLCVRRDL